MNSSTGTDSPPDSQSSARPAVGPVMQFSLLIVPVVMSAFFLVYALTGWVLEGRDRINWSIEAESVALWVGAGIIGFCALVACWVLWSGGTRWHPLIVSSIGHAVLAVLLVSSIFVTTRL